MKNGEIAIPLKDPLTLKLKIGLHGWIILGWHHIRLTWNLSRGVFGSFLNHSTQRSHNFATLRNFLAKIHWLSLFSISEIAINFSALLKIIVRATITIALLKAAVYFSLIIF